MLTIETLNAFGADTKEGLERCFGKEDFLLRLVRMIPDDKNFAKLEEAVAAGDLRAGFEAAHGLKGVLGNLSLTPLYQPVCEITEYLRAGTEMDYQPLLSEILAKRDALRALCED